jgi:hypothetical protein
MVFLRVQQDVFRVAAGCPSCSRPVRLVRHDVSFVPRILLAAVALNICSISLYEGMKFLGVDRGILKPATLAAVVVAWGVVMVLQLGRSDIVERS